MTNIIEEAFQMGTLAVEADKELRFTEAKDRYIKAAELFLKARSVETDKQKKKLLEAKAKAFIEYAEQVKRQPFVKFTDH
jgi:hypothetical protein